MAEKEYIDREVLLEFLQTTYNIPLDQWMARNYWSKVVEIKQKFISCIEKIPAADVAPVVRCKDCKHYQPVTPTCGNCFRTTFIQHPDDFCSRGERKEQDNV